jgi:PAS domain S-box-containing protein
MYKFLTAMAILLLVLGSFNSYADDNSVRVGVYQNYPLMFKDKNDKTDGFGYDIIKQIAAKEGWKLDFVYGTWSEIYTMTVDGSIDITFPVAFTLERAEILLYNNETVISNWGQVYLRKGVSAKSMLDLDNKVIAVLQDDVYFSGKYGMQYLASAFNLDIKYHIVDSYQKVLEALDKGEADAGLVNRFFGLANDSEYNVTKSTILIHPVEVRYALPKNSDKSFRLIAKLDEYIREMKHQENSAYNQSYNKWIGLITADTLMDNVKMSLYVLIFPLTVAVIIFFVLRMEIRRKTKELMFKNTELQKEVTERRKAQSELRENQEKYSNLFNTSYNPIAIIAEDGSLVDVNGEMINQFGYDRDDLLKLNLEKLVTPESVHNVQEIVKKMMKTRKWSFELDFVKSWGDVFNAEISASRLDISGKTFIQLVIMDITSRKKASELLNRRQEYLERKVEQEVHRRRQNERLMMQQSKMAAMGQMMSAIAHQWRQPLNTIAIYVQDFEDSFRHNELDEKYVRELVDLSMNQINFMSKTIDDFKNFFKPDKDEIIFEVCRETISAIALLGVQLVRNNIRLVLNCHGQIIHFEKNDTFDCEYDMCHYVKGFPNEYKQVLLNLVQNAKDAIDDRFQESGRDGVIEVGVTEDDTHVKIYVTDNGGGIPADVAERIFEPYFTTKEEGRGTGVGLYMSKIIIEQNMHGRLYFENQNPGTKFVIELRKSNPPVSQENKTKLTEPHQTEIPE